MSEGTRTQGFLGLLQSSPGYLPIRKNSSSPALPGDPGALQSPARLCVAHLRIASWLPGSPVFPPPPPLPPKPLPHAPLPGTLKPSPGVLCVLPKHPSVSLSGDQTSPAPDLGACEPTFLSVSLWGLQWDHQGDPRGWKERGRRGLTLPGAREEGDVSFSPAPGHHP